MTRPSAGRPLWDAVTAGPAAGPPTTPAARARVRGVLDADVTVVGAGLAGLSTAYHLAAHDPGRSVLVVDAEGPAAGASGRGTGLLGPRVGPSVDRAVRRFGPDTARRMYAASTAAVERVRELSAELGVDTGPREATQVVATRTAAGLASLARQAAAYRELGLDVPVLSAAEIGALVEVPRHAGLRYRAATLDPAELSRALAAACAAKGVRFLGNSPLRAVRAETSGGVRLVFPGGTVRSRKAVLAVNAAAGSLGLPVGTVLPLSVHAVATAPLPADAQRALGGDTRCALIDAHPLGDYFRLTPDGRLMFGGGRPVLAPVSDDSAATAVWAGLEQRLRRLHPALAQAEVTHRWAGRIGMTGDDLPVVGPLAGLPDVWYVGGCCGHGLAMSVAHGAHVAEALCGGSPELLPWHRSRAPKLPLPAPVRPLLRAGLSRMARAARREA